MRRAGVVLWLLCVALAGLSACARGVSSRPATLILKNARVWTVHERRREAGAVAVDGDRIARVGSDAEAEELRGGFNLLSVKLRDAASPEEFARRIGGFARSLPKGEWILGGDWDHELWPGAPLPSRRLIDGVTPDNPVFVNRLDGHMSLTNSLALRLAGVTRATRDPAPGLLTDLALPPEQIDQTVVLYTIVGGRVVYEGGK